ncbi:hypothetical protein PNO31109_02593 [Pandoraea nosoerga]|uniref:Uncharacterized protein n=1 Tax=Pandoraea nosoerga TaxID=2508296 RepID=A0A5E4VEY2_9BURK|nr:hypothetical protein PNO31109_02593 [Pandoraea nosoerga]
MGGAARTHGERGAACQTTGPGGSIVPLRMAACRRAGAPARRRRITASAAACGFGKVPSAASVRPPAK